MFRLPALYPILDTGVLAARGFAPRDAAVALLDGGAGIVQFRHKGPFTREVFASAEAVGEACRKAGATYVIDDRADIALMLDAGVHLGQEDLMPADARRLLGPGRVVGFSTHNEAQLRAAGREPVDYVALGPIFGTASKANPDPVLGVGEMRRLRALSTRPLVAIGGIDLDNAAEVWKAGADSVAVIASLFPAGSGVAEVRRRAEAFLALGITCM